MSISRGSMQELCDIIENKPSSVLGNKFFDTRMVLHIEFSHKADKFESRFFVISKFRLFLLTGKNANNLKIDRSYHILHIKSICIQSENEAALIVDEVGTRRRMIIRGFPAEELALTILRTLRHYFSDICPLLRRIIELHPDDLYAKTNELVMDVSPRPCHSFRRTYAALCDFHDIPYRDEVAWDVEKIYTVNRITDMRIDDFSHLSQKDLLPIVAVLQYSSYFTGLVVEGVRVSAEMVDVIMGVVRHSLSLITLILSNCGLTREFPGLLAAAIAENDGIPIQIIDLSKNNTLDDRKGFASLCTSIVRLPTLSSLNLCDCSLSEKSANQLCSSLYGCLSASTANKGVVRLNLASNVIKDDLSSLINLVSLSCSLRSLNLSDCHTPLDRLWPSLKYGCLQLEDLILSGCTIVSSKKGATDANSAAKEFFAASVGLRHLDLSRVALPSDLLKAILSGLTANNQVNSFSLLLDGAVDKSGALILSESLPFLRASSLSLRDCHLDTDLPGVLESIVRMPCLASLFIGGSNFVNLKKNAKQAPFIAKAINQLVHLITTSHVIEEVSLADARLGIHINGLINSLGVCPSLRFLDLSGNDFGNFGARMLSKALELNTSLRRVRIDGNHVSGEGLADMATALDENLSLTAIPCPYNDIAEAITRGADRTKVASSWSRIEASLERNRSGDAVCATMKRKLGGERGDWPHAQKTIDDFIHKVECEAGAWIREELKGTSGGDRGHHSYTEAVDRAQRHAMDGLRETVKRALYTAVSDWQWREVCAMRENEGRIPAAATNKGLAETRSYTPRSDCASPSSAFRPKSILTEIKHEGETLADIMGPPLPSSLVHLSKSRPRPLRRRAIQSGPSSPPIDEERPSSPSDSIGSSSIENRPTERVSSRVAMIPPLENGDKFTFDKAGGDVSPSLSPAPSAPVPFSFNPLDSPPPPLPRRLTATPPCLPPKPDRPERVSRDGSTDESPSSSRRSVADMARLFNR